MIKQDFFDQVDSLRSGLLLEFEIKPPNFFAHRAKLLFTTPARMKNGKKVIFRLAFDKEFNRSIDREVLLYQTAEKKHLDFFPNLIDFGQLLGLKWLMYDYIDWQPSGDTYRFNISENINFDLILQPLKKLNLLNFLAGSKLIKKCGRKTWPDLIERIVEKDKNLLSDPLIRAAVAKVRKKKFYPSQLFYVHGDYHPKNIFLKDKKIKIIDWESSHFDSFAFDYSFVWIRSYNEKIREKIWQYLSRQYPAKINEINYVFLVNLLRDYFEWHEAMKKKNELLILDKINKSIIKNTVHDLYSKIEFFSNKPN